jgi:hypothetical protein
MLGWQVYIRTLNQSVSNDRRQDIVSWTTSVGGLSWIDDLVKSGNAVALGGNGYPLRYSIKAEVLRSILFKGLPSHNSPSIVGDDYFLPEGFNGSLQINKDMLNGFAHDEELIITAWDLS